MSNRIYYISIIWGIVILLYTLFPDSIGNPRYNGYYVLVCSSACFLIRPNINILGISSIITIILISYSTDIIHPVLDGAIILMVLNSFVIALKSKYTNNQKKYVFWLLLTFIIADLIGMLDPNLYILDKNSLRYIGILYSTNTSVTVFGLAQIAAYELMKDKARKRGFLLFIIISFCIMAMGTRTRSILFFIPYWVFQIYDQVDKKIFILFCIMLTAIIVQNIFSFVKTFRFEEDASYITRAFLYKNLYEGIKENYFIIPHGANSSTTLSQQLTVDNNFSTHNDFLRYYYDWGIIFLLIILFCYRQFKRNLKLDWKYLTIVFAWSSGALHNIMFLPFEYFIFIIATNIYFSKSMSNLNKK